ncbi:hypothetical protein B0H94_110118 [Salsuginibacillus halophilus]|uniref:TIGR01777 family protein n=1 Tax=Salsuginibacillus halophilus TaxID=517424 RepID=A0A2P8HBQ5_9BACI|nr:TIGR01777 family oxidoreductase [Salsuginibacillus halophilus]PSL43642.1 hypothetical protein B0H94_110118 [Salsuginibacillus halophilus]
MHVAIAGGTGLVGSLLTDHLIHAGADISILTRNALNKQNSERITYVEWLNDRTPEHELGHVDAFVNLAGASINERWTEDHKQKILDSRIEATREIVRLCGALPEKPGVLINASAVGYYGTSTTDVFTEDSRPVERNFLQHVCERWEEEAAEAEKIYGVRTVFARLGLVLHDQEGALPNIVLPYKLFAGGPVGSGEQWYSWVHWEDVVEMIHFAIDQPDLSGPMNVVAPHPKRMKQFGRTLASVLGRPHWIPAPSIALKTALGEMSVLVLEGQKVLPARAEAHGYSFVFPELRPALEDLLQ